MNWYGYCGGDPLNLVDPTGWEAQEGGVEGWLADAMVAYFEGGDGAVIRGVADNAVDQFSLVNLLGLQGTEFDEPDGHFRPFGTNPNGGEAKLGQIASVVWGVALGANQIAGGTRSGTRTNTGSRQVSAVKTTGAAERGGLNLFRAGPDGWATREAATGWRQGDRMLYLPNQGSAQANWAQNAGRLRQEMRAGDPIFDSYRDAATGLQIPAGTTPTSGGRFLNAERKLLESRGWQYNALTGAYHPPMP